jgi:hypothetical protein
MAYQVLRKPPSGWRGINSKLGARSDHIEQGCSTPIQPIKRSWLVVSCDLNSGCSPSTAPGTGDWSRREKEEGARERGGTAKAAKNERLRPLIATWLALNIGSSWSLVGVKVELMNIFWHFIELLITFCISSGTQLPLRWSITGESDQCVPVHILNYCLLKASFFTLQLNFQEWVASMRVGTILRYAHILI